MSCDPTWEVCDTPATTSTSDKGKGTSMADDQVVMDSDDDFIFNTFLWGLAASGLFWTSYNKKVNLLDGTSLLLAESSADEKSNYKDM